MDKKKPVQLRPYIKTRYVYQKLRVCKHCHNFTILWEDSCAFCKRHSLVHVMELAEKKAKRSMQSDRLLFYIIGLSAVLLSQTFLQIVISFACMVVLLVWLWLIQRRVLQTETLHALDKLIRSHQKQILDGLDLNKATAAAAIKEDAQLGYEIVREISSLVRNDRIRLQQIVLLQTFSLRKDMELELEPLLLNEFDPDLAAYIGEIAKIKRELINSKAIRYLLDHEADILRMEQGRQIMIDATGAAVRKKKYIDTFPDFISRYADGLPRYRFLRLYQIVRRNPGLSWNGLRDRVSAIYNEQYRSDPDFQKWD
ncbi:hypothetical protein PVOR_30813 [Paenibacillus vortex V453]|uniref:Uncharacterized protein n=2 Tax=Paenibacillus TaxID=44249 RepID=A0A163HLX8_9BACL|nr:MULTISPECIES: hypothetical protein [Paenibacillus]EFU38485.1 hypothetical protein PVOR_30813 [Paenibacillus vortex V453]KZS45549.1 hypothetical protein AWU65_06240 [Paenibacillus glucanolyticus]